MPTPKVNAVIEIAIKSCPFCGSPSDDCHNEEDEGYLGCSNEQCPASKLAMTDIQWNTRAENPKERTLLLFERIHHDLQKLCVENGLPIPLTVSVPKLIRERNQPTPDHAATARAIAERLWSEFLAGYLPSYKDLPQPEKNRMESIILSILEAKEGE